MTRRWIIDTDTASDDVLAIMMALRDPRVHVEAITVVAGNLPLALAVRNALISVEQARTYAPPVYPGCAKPLLRPLYTSEFVHGSDGMGEMNLPDPQLVPQAGHAVDALIDLIQQHPHEIELITLGPLTNLALAYLKEPRLAQWLKRVVVMGGQGAGPGNVTPAAEFNLYVDAEAAQIILDSGMPLTFVGWDASTDETFIHQADIDRWLATQSPIAAFCVRCNATLQAYNATSWGLQGFDLPDPVAVAVALEPDIMTSALQAFCQIEIKSDILYGHMLIDRQQVLKRPPNATICLKIDAQRFKALLLRLLS